MRKDLLFLLTILSLAPNLSGCFYYDRAGWDGRGYRYDRENRNDRGYDGPRGGSRDNEDRRQDPIR